MIKIKQDSQNPHVKLQLNNEELMQVAAATSNLQYNNL